MMDWLPEDDIVHLIVDAVAIMDLSEFKADYKLGRAGQAPFAPQVLLALLIDAYSHGVRSSRVIERLCGRDAGYCFIVGDAVPDHTVTARFRQRHVGCMREVFLAVLRLCHETGVVRLGLVALDGTKVGADAALDANRTASRIDEQVAKMLAEAEATDAQEDGQFNAQRGGELPAALARRGDCLAELFIATQKDHAQRGALRDAPPRGRKPKNMKVRERMQRKLRTERGRTRYRQHGVSIEPVFGQIKDPRAPAGSACAGSHASAASGCSTPLCTTCASYTGTLSAARKRLRNGPRNRC